MNWELVAPVAWIDGMPLLRLRADFGDGKTTNEEQEFLEFRTG